MRRPPTCNWSPTNHRPPYQSAVAARCSNTLQLTMRRVHKAAKRAETDGHKRAQGPHQQACRHHSRHHTTTSELQAGSTWPMSLWTPHDVTDGRARISEMEYCANQAAIFPRNPAWCYVMPTLLRTLPISLDEGHYPYGAWNTATTHYAHFDFSAQ